MGLGLRMKKFDIIGVHWKIRFLGGAWKKQFLGVNRLKRAAWIVCRFKRELGKKEKVMFLRGEEGGLRPQCTLWVGRAFLLTQITTVSNIVTQ